MIPYKKAALAGILGTLGFDITGFALTQQWWDIPHLLANKLGFTSVLPGVVAHYGIGILLAILYAGVAPSLFGNRWVRALTFVSAETVFGVYLFMFPLLGAGIGGVGLGAIVPVIVMARHWVFGVVLAAVLPSDASVPVQLTPAES